MFVTTKPFSALVIVGSNAKSKAWFSLAARRPVLAVEDCFGLFRLVLQDMAFD